MWHYFFSVLLLYEEWIGYRQCMPSTPVCLQHLQHTQGGRRWVDHGLPVTWTHPATELLPCLLPLQLPLLYSHHGWNMQWGGKDHLYACPLWQTLIFSHSSIYSLQCNFEHPNPTGNLLQHAWHQYWCLISDVQLSITMEDVRTFSVFIIYY